MHTTWKGSMAQLRHRPISLGSHHGPWPQIAIELGSSMPSTFATTCNTSTEKSSKHINKKPLKVKTWQQMYILEDVTQVATVDGNQKSGKLTSWWKGSEKHPLFTRALAPSKRWLGMGFLNHQQYDTYPPKFNMEPENYLLGKEKHLPKPAFLTYISLGFRKRWHGLWSFRFRSNPTCGAVDPSVVIVTGDSIRYKCSKPQLSHEKHPDMTFHWILVV